MIISLYPINLRLFLHVTFIKFIQFKILSAKMYSYIHPGAGNSPARLGCEESLSSPIHRPHTWDFQFCLQISDITWDISEKKCLATWGNRCAHFWLFAVSIALICGYPCGWREQKTPKPQTKPSPSPPKAAPQYRRRLLLQNQIPLEAFSICVIFIGFFFPFMPNSYTVIFFLIYFFNTILPPLAPNRLLHNLFYSTLQ